MAKSRRKKNYKLRRRVMRTIAALTMIMAVVVAAIPVENLGTVQADSSRALGDISGELGGATAYYDKNSYEKGFNGTTPATVQRIIERDGGGSFIDVFEVQKKSTGNEAMIIKDIIGDGHHGSEKELTINATEYCDYVQFDSNFIADVETGLGSADSFEVEFTSTPQSIRVPGNAPSGNTLSPIQIDKLSLENPRFKDVAVSININTNPYAQGYTTFPNLSSLSSKVMYEHDFGKGIYDERAAAIGKYIQDTDALIASINNFNTKVSAANYTWQGSDTTEWNGFADQASALKSRHDSLQKLSTSWTGFGNADNGLNVIVDHIIRNYCKNGSKDLVSFRLKGLTKQNGSGDTEGVYVPQYTGQGNYTGQLDDKKYLAASTSVQIRGIASYDPNGNPVFHNTHLESVVLPQGITFIGKGAFGDSDLKSVTMNATTCEIIGEEAFAGCSLLQTIEFTFGGSDGSNSFMTIDKKAFDSTALTSVKIPYSVTIVGAGAFNNANSLKEVIFDDTGRKQDIQIEKYAFYDCTSLTNVAFPDNNTKQYKIGKGAFAIANPIANPGETLENFKFPGGNTDIDYGTEAEYDYILANRNTLKTVTFPGGLKSKVPDNTLSGCNYLSYVVFPEGAKSATYDPEALFVDVWGDPGFYVEGPEIYDTPSSYAKPREATWKAKAGKTGADTWALTSVPYKFTRGDKVHFEIGVSDESGDLKYIANIEEIDKENKLASLISYFLYDKNTKPEKEWIKIPTTVGEYTIVSIEEGCFDDAKELKDNVTKLSIGDGITDIKAGAFKEMPALQWVEIGSGVKNIGSEAFAGCKNLENVVFSQAITGTLPEDSVEYWRELKIAEDAFKTDSERLTFHGAVNPEYRPFQIAMSPDNSDLLKTDRQICYKTDAPLNLTIIRNRNGGKATLVNYPHYEDMDSAVVNAFEAVYINDNGSEDDRKLLDSDAGKAISQTLKMELPSGIESIDSKSFFDTKSGNDLDYEYISKNYTQQEKNADGTDSQLKSDYKWDDIADNDKPVNNKLPDKKDLQSLYSLDGDKYVSDEAYATVLRDTAYENNDPDKAKIVSTGGLFSGGFKETDSPDPVDVSKGIIWSNPYEGHKYRESYTSGNDYLTSINMRSVKDLPNYAFDSCENLLTVAFNAMESMGNLPFRGCENLYLIDTGDSNSKYAFENLLLYEKKDDGSMEIVECLEGRGKGNGDNGHYYYTGSITGTGEEGANVDTLISNVTSIREGAFSNCKVITTVDLTASRVDRVPQRAFENCTDLWQVKLPETVRAIDQKAFKNAADRELYVEIKNPDCTIAVDAFDFKTTKEVFIKGISTNYKGEESTCHLNYEQIKKELEKSGIDENRIHWSELGSTCILTFEDGDTGDLIKKQEVPKGESLENPPTAPDKSGFKFRYWLCTEVRDENGNPLMGEATYSNVTEDRRIRAIYEKDPNTTISDGKDYNLTVVNGNAIIGGTMVSTPTTIKGGTPVTIVAKDEKNFQVWTIVPNTQISLLMNPSSPATSFTMPNADITVTANTAIGGGTDTPNPDGTYTVTVNNGTGSGQYKPGATVTITANKPNAGASFVNWTTATAGVSFAGATSSSTTFVMPSSNVTVTANFSDGSGGQPGGNTPGGDSGKKYKVTVNYGSGSGEYEAGATVNITANAPDSSSRVFSRWTTNNSGLGFANANSVSTSFVMPAADVTVTANYKTRTNDDDDDDDDGPSRRPGTNTTTNTVTNRPGSSTSTTGTNGTVSNPASGTGSDNGNRIYITKNGISNTDVASLAVSGSTDNFIVRITESPEATAAVEQALTNTYGSLNGLAYLPMDISLYDSTGQNKITDTTGLNITVTMPIPDVLIQYGGNARVAAADNGNLQQITPRFTTIDGIACVSFVPPHFSPYVIYVDTNNLIAGNMLDSTPATGDPIHPKWFAAIGMACVSILLFVLSDGRKRRKYRAA